MQDGKKINMICVLGPTASGKTALGVSLAETFNGEVISADSMQIYKGSDIATAKPSKEEMRGIKHHMISFLDPSFSYSVADYVSDARAVISDIVSRGKIPVLVGGTGLYINSLLGNIEFAPVAEDTSVRENFLYIAEKNGVDYLLAYLETFDPESAFSLRKQRNLKRIIRAIEVYEITGKTITQHNAESRKNPSPYSAVKIGLTCRDRNNLYERINQRVDKMLSDGLIDEAEQVWNSQKTGTAVQAIGCKELFPYFRGDGTLEECIDVLKRETRRYAKRQLTWFRRDNEINWIFTDDYKESADIAEAAKGILKKRGY